MGALEIRTFKHDQRGLWPLLGPFLCNREALKELQGPIYSADGVVWFIALERDVAVGFCSLRPTETAYWFDYAYVVPERRGRGIFSKLAAARDAHIAELDPLPLRVSVPERRWKHYRTRGWDEHSRRGSWVYGIREVHHG
jgi:GNAT superfamily N-acetyltransferase